VFFPLTGKESGVGFVGSSHVLFNGAWRRLKIPEEFKCVWKLNFKGF